MIDEIQRYAYKKYERGETFFGGRWRKVLVVFRMGHRPSPRISLNKFKKRKARNQLVEQPEDMKRRKVERPLKVLIRDLAQSVNREYPGKKGTKEERSRNDLVFFQRKQGKKGHQLL